MTPDQANKLMQHDVDIRELKRWRKDVDAGRAPLPDRIALYGTLFLVLLQTVLR